MPLPAPIPRILVYHLCLVSTLFSSSKVAMVTALSTTMPLQDRATLMELLPESGFMCNDPAEARRVCEACEALESAAAGEEGNNDNFLEDLDGKWRLRFTSASPYGLLRSLPDDTTTQVFQQIPEPIRKTLIDDSPLLATKVEQIIDKTDCRVVNCIDLVPWPKTNGGDALQQALNAVPGPLGQTIAALQEANIHLELDHSFSAEGTSKSIDLSLETIRRTLESAGEELPMFIPKESTYNLPFNPTGSFETTYMDKTLRISRGTSFPFQNEILVFEREGSVEPPAGFEPDISVAEECELSYEEDGSPVMLCENEDEADALPSD